MAGSATNCQRRSKNPPLTGVKTHHRGDVKPEMTSSSIKIPVKDSLEQRQKLSGVLHLTSITGGFDKTRDVALGPHCFIGRFDMFPEWRDMVSKTTAGPKIIDTGIDPDRPGRGRRQGQGT